MAIVTNAIAGEKRTLYDWLDDLCVRFIINIPEEELSSVERICFQIEEAQWFYEDFIRPLDPSLPSMSLRTFCLRIFQHCPLLSQFSSYHREAAYSEFLAYKTRVPVRGAIMLNDTMEQVVLVKGWKKGANWSFPRGKINKDESDLDCAVREVYEETGFDVRAASLVKAESEMKSIEVSMREQHMRLYVFRGVPTDTYFEPKTRKEISQIKWYNLSDLPAYKKNKKGKDAEQAGETIKDNKFYMVAPFLVPLRKWIAEQIKNCKEHTATAGSVQNPVAESAAGRFDAVATADETEGDLTTDEYFFSRESRGKEEAAKDFNRLLDHLRASTQPAQPKASNFASNIEALVQDRTAQLKRLLIVGDDVELESPHPVSLSPNGVASQSNRLLAMLQGERDSQPVAQPQRLPPVQHYNLGPGKGGFNQSQPPLNPIEAFKRQAAQHALQAKYPAAPPPPNFSLAPLPPHFQTHASPAQRNYQLPFIHPASLGPVGGHNQAPYLPLHQSHIPSHQAPMAFPGGPPHITGQGHYRIPPAPHPGHHFPLDHNQTNLSDLPISPYEFPPQQQSYFPNPRMGPQFAMPPPPPPRPMFSGQPAVHNMAPPVNAPPAKLTDHAANLLNSLRDPHPTPPQVPVPMANSLVTTPPKPGRVEGSTREVKNLAPQVSPPEQSTTSSVTIGASRKEGKSHRNTLLDIFRTPVDPASSTHGQVYAEPIARLLASQPAELSAGPSNRTNSRNGFSEKFSNFNNEASIIEASSRRIPQELGPDRSEPGWTAATVHGPLPDPEFSVIRQLKASSERAEGIKQLGLQLQEPSHNSEGAGARDVASIQLSPQTISRPTISSSHGSEATLKASIRPAHVVEATSAATIATVTTKPAPSIITEKKEQHQSTLLSLLLTGGSKDSSASGPGLGSPVKFPLSPFQVLSSPTAMSPTTASSFSLNGRPAAASNAVSPPVKVGVKQGQKKGPSDRDFLLGYLEGVVNEG